MDKQTGILSVFYVFWHKDIDGRQRRVQSLVMREHNVTQQQAKGLFLDYRGMNPGYRENLESTWCARVSLT